MLERPNPPNCERCIKRKLEYRPPTKDNRRIMRVWQNLRLGIRQDVTEGEADLVRMLEEIRIECERELLVAELAQALRQEK
jgi:hypothetical protein